MNHVRQRDRKHLGRCISEEAFDTLTGGQNVQFLLERQTKIRTLHGAASCTTPHVNPEGKMGLRRAQK
jgi:hypothetical protein